MSQSEASLRAAVKAGELAADLDRLLKSNGVGEPVRQYLAGADCLTVRNFFNRCDSPLEVSANIVEPAFPPPAPAEGASEEERAEALRAHKELRLAEKARVLQSWREAEALVKRALEKLADKNPEEADEPLPPEEHAAVMETFQSYYKWTLRGNQMVSDGLLARYRRAFQKVVISVWPIAKTQSLATSHRGQEPKRHKVSPGIPLEWVSNVEETADGDTRKWLRLLKLASNGWAVAGCYEVDHFVMHFELAKCASAGAPWFPFYLLASIRAGSV